MSSYSYYYVKTIVEDGRPPKTYKFAKGYPLQATKDAWSTLGRYNLLSRLLRGGLSGSGDVHHPANTTFKVCYPALSAPPYTVAINLSYPCDVFYIRSRDEFAEFAIFNYYALFLILALDKLSTVLIQKRL